jgi:hypothetical protein
MESQTYQSREGGDSDLVGARDLSLWVPAFAGVT